MVNTPDPSNISTMCPTAVSPALTSGAGLASQDAWLTNGENVTRLRKFVSIILIGIVSAALAVAIEQPAHATHELGFPMRNVLTGKCLASSPYDNYFANGNPIIQDTCNGEPEQRWSLVDVGNGFYHLVNQRSFMCMDVKDGYALDGGTVQQWTCTNTIGMNWRFYEIDSHSIQVISQINPLTPMCLDAWSSRLLPHGDILTWHCSSNNGAQTFI